MENRAILSQTGEDQVITPLLELQGLPFKNRTREQLPFIVLYQSSPAGFLVTELFPIPFQGHYISHTSFSLDPG